MTQPSEKLQSSLVFQNPTVHKDIREKLPELSPELYKEVEKLLEINKQERHIRGGMATKRKYEILSMEKNKAAK